MVFSCAQSALYLQHSTTAANLADHTYHGGEWWAAAVAAVAAVSGFGTADDIHTSMAGASA